MSLHVYSSRGRAERQWEATLVFAPTQWEAFKQLSAYRKANPQYKWWLEDIWGRRVGVHNPSMREKA